MKHHDVRVRAWLAIIAVLPIALSLAAAVQYKCGAHGGAGAAATAVYWVLFAIFIVRVGVAFVPGALLQTSAWFVARPREGTGRTASATQKQDECISPDRHSP